MALTSLDGPAALVTLYDSRQILAGDYLAGCRFAFLWRHRDQQAFGERFRAALAVLERAGTDARAMVEQVAVYSRPPRGPRGLSRCLSGLDVLNEHFRQTGQLTERA